MERRRVATSFIERYGRVLVLRRSDRVRTYPGLWAGVSGAIETDDPISDAWRGITEETGFGREEVEFMRGGDTLVVADPDLDVEWEVHPFLFRSKTAREPKLDWEHVEARWVVPEDLELLKTVPGLAAALRKVL